MLFFLTVKIFSLVLVPFQFEMPKKNLYRSMFHQFDLWSYVSFSRIKRIKRFSKVKVSMFPWKSEWISIFTKTGFLGRWLKIFLSWASSLKAALLTWMGQNDSEPCFFSCGDLHVQMKRSDSLCSFSVVHFAKWALFEGV